MPTGRFEMSVKDPQKTMGLERKYSEIIFTVEYTVFGRGLEMSIAKNLQFYEDGILQELKEIPFEDIRRFCREIDKDYFERKIEDRIHGHYWNAV